MQRRLLRPNKRHLKFTGAIATCDCAFFMPRQCHETDSAMKLGGKLFLAKLLVVLIVGAFMESERPHKAHSTVYYLVKVIGVVIAVIGILVAVATLGINHPIMKGYKQGVCNMNIEAIEEAKQMWAYEYKKDDNDTPSKDELLPHLQHGIFPTCPSGGTYTINANNVRATCSVHAPVEPPITRSIRAD